MVNNDHDNNDTLTSVTDPLQRMQIRALMAEEKRKQAKSMYDIARRK